MKWKHVTPLSAAIAFVFAFACSDSTTPIDNRHVLDGLVESNSNDTVSTPPPDTSEVQPGPGSFHGVVFGPGTPPDTIQTAPRIANVRVDVYPDLGWDGDDKLLGDRVATFLSNGDGEFQSPTLEGGPYVVTFTPADETYRGTYVTTLIYEASNTGTWWILLAEK